MEPTTEPGHYVEAAGLLVAAASAGWAARCCRTRAGQKGADARVWTAVSVLYVALALGRVTRIGPWLGGLLRQLARGHHLYGERRPLQITVTLGLAVVALIALIVGLRSILDFLRRYRLAAACVCITLAFALIRFVSLHEVDAWNDEWPWARVAIDLLTSLGASAAALARVRQLGTSSSRTSATSQRTA
jgi:hypothetical protein